MVISILNSTVSKPASTEWYDDILLTIRISDLAGLPRPYWSVSEQNLPRIVFFLVKVQLGAQ